MTLQATDLIYVALHFIDNTHTNAAAELVSGQGTKFMTIEKNGNVAKRLCSMTTPSLMDILPGKPIYVYIKTRTARPVNFRKVMIAAYVSSAHQASSRQEMMSRTC